MPTSQELERKFWDALSSDRTMMLGLHATDEGHTRPMTAMLDESRRSMWFFTVKDSAMVHQLDAHQLEGGHRAVATFAAKDHDLFATIHGTLLVESDPAMIDRLWNSHVAAWYDGGRNDPNIVLLRLDPEQAEIWENASSLLAGIKLMFGADPKKDYRDKVARVDLRH
jgi:general stress protein 26